MSTGNIKDEAKRLLERLPDDLTRDDLMHEIYVRQSIEAGLADSEAGNVVEVAESKEAIRIAVVKVLGRIRQLRKLQAIHDYLAQTSPDYAVRIIDRLTKRSIQIAAFPNSGRMVPEYERDEIREVIEGRYRIIYLVEPAKSRSSL